MRKMTPCSSDARGLRRTIHVKIISLVCMGLALVVASGCSSTSKKIKNLQLGMAPDEVRDKVGTPFTVRAAKVYEDGRTMEVWEYIPRFSLNPKQYWVYFENGKVVQWGQPGDFSTRGGTDVPVNEYSPVKQTK